MLCHGKSNWLNSCIPTPGNKQTSQHYCLVGAPIIAAITARIAHCKRNCYPMDSWASSHCHSISSFYGNSSLLTWLWGKQGNCGSWGVFCFVGISKLETNAKIKIKKWDQQSCAIDVKNTLVMWLSCHKIKNGQTLHIFVMSHDNIITLSFPTKFHQ